MMMYGYISRAILFTTLLVIIAGCEGPQGPMGRSVGSLDLQDPFVVLLSPLPGDTIPTDTFSISVEATDNDEIAYVKFFIDGRFDLGENGVAVDSHASLSTYSTTWDLHAGGISEGLHYLVARAVDRSRNFTDTPSIPLYYITPTGSFEIGYDKPGNEGVLGLPDHQGSVYFGDRYFNVRFTPLRACTLKEVRFEFANPQSVNPPYAGGADIYVFAWTSDNFLPDEFIDSVYVPEPVIQYDQWTSIDVSAWNLSFEAGEDFHAGFSPPDSLYNIYIDENKNAPLMVSVDTNLPEDRSHEHRSCEYEAEGEARGWGTMQDHWQAKFDFHIRVLVDFGGGETTLINPGGEIIPIKKTSSIKNNRYNLAKGKSGAGRE